MASPTQWSNPQHQYLILSYIQLISKCCDLCLHNFIPSSPPILSSIWLTALASINSSVPVVYPVSCIPGTTGGCCRDNHPWVIKKKEFLFCIIYYHHVSVKCVCYSMYVEDRWQLLKVDSLPLTWDLGFEVRSLIFRGKWSYLLSYLTGPRLVCLTCLSCVFIPLLKSLDKFPLHLEYTSNASWWPTGSWLNGHMQT